MAPSSPKARFPILRALFSFERGNKVRYLYAELARPTPEYAPVPYFNFILAERLSFSLRNDAREDDQ